MATWNTGTYFNLWKLDWLVGVAACLRELTAVDAARRMTGGMDDYDMKKLAPSFKQSFGALSVLMTGKEGQKQTKGMDSVEKPTFPSPRTGQKRPPSVSLASSSSKRSKGEDDVDLPQEPTTPDQPTRPSDPEFTRDSSRTEESQTEESTKSLVVSFVAETLDALDREFAYLYWQTSGHPVHIFKTYSLRYLFSKSSALDTMKYKLGCEIVRPSNDGGLRIRYNLGTGDIDFREGGIRPVLSFEAKRRKSKRRDDPELPWEYAGQIFAEMLGQVCYKDFYQNPAMDYQEVSP